MNQHDTDERLSIRMTPDHAVLRHQKFGHVGLAGEDAAFDGSAGIDLPGSMGDHHLLLLPRAKTNIEAIMGLLAAFFIGIPAPLITVAFVAMFLDQFMNQNLMLIVSGLTLIVTSYLCVTVIRVAARAVEGEQGSLSFSIVKEFGGSSIDEQEIFIPLAIAMSIRLPKWWWVAMRPFISVWWLCHFIAAAIVGHMAARQMIGNNNPEIISILFALAVNLAFLFAANLYLMLAIAVGIPRPSIWLVAWRYRLLFDLVVTFVTIVCS